MSVHYKFKSSLDYDTITFDGLHISVNDFRKAVIQQKRLGKANDFELQITNAQTKEEYENDNDLIPKNTSLIISRIPQTSKRVKDVQSQNTPNVCHVPKFDSNSLDLSQMNASEEDKIQAMMVQSTADYDPRGYQKIRGPGQTGEVPPTYRCYKCHQTGHWIKNCPLPHSNSKKSEIRRNTGIPKSFLQEKSSEKEVSTEGLVLIEKRTEVPDELMCSICQDIFRDAVMIPCCGSSFCDDCVRTALLESEENECPDCKEKGTSPGSLIPNRFLRSSVNTFRNETGYERNKKSNGTNESNAVTNENTTEKSVEEDAESSKCKLPVNEQINPVKTDTAEVKDVDLLSSKDDCVPLKTEDIVKTKSQEKEEFRKQSPIDRKSPTRRVEVVVPQREISRSADIQTRSEDMYNQAFSTYGSNIADMPPRSNISESYLARAESFIRHSKQNQELSVSHLNYCNNYDNRTDRYYYAREPYNINATPYSFLPNPRCRQAVPHSNIQPYYQGMPGTIESGIIEDPLEAFNRIMKEKEKRKEMKRMANERHRSSASNRPARDISPATEKRNRHRASPLTERRNRSPLRQEKPSNHRNLDREKNVRGHRIHYSNKRSFSRSNSPPSRRYSKSPRRRSRSRSHIRSYSREVDTLRHDSKLTKRILHRLDHDKDNSRYNKKSLGTVNESKTELPPKESKVHNFKTKDNTGQSFDNNSVRPFNEMNNTQNADYEFNEKRNKIPSRNVDKKTRNNEDSTYNMHEYGESPRQSAEKKNRERRKKREKDEKVDKKPKKDKKDKKKRERHKDDQKRHSEHKKMRREHDSRSLKNVADMRLQIHSNKKSSSRSSNEEFLHDRNDNFTPELSLSCNIGSADFINNESDKIDGKSTENSNTLKMDNSPLSNIDICGRNVNNAFSGKNTPTSFVDTTPENYIGKWDNFDFSMPNSEDMKGENDHESEIESNMSQKYLPRRNEHFESSEKYLKREETFANEINIDKKSRSEQFLKEKQLELSKNITCKRSSRTPSGIVSSSSNTSNIDRSSQSKKRRKKSKHKKGKRSSSAESSKTSKKSVSKHKRSKSEKKKKTRRIDPH